MLPEAGTLPSASVMYERYLRFRNELALLCYDRLQRINELTFSEYATHATEFCKDKQDILTSGLPQSWGETLKDPHLPMIRAALESLKCASDSYLILRKAGIGSTYIQAIKTAKDCYHVEVQEGDRDRSSKLISSDLRTVFELFCKFREWDLSYRHNSAWETNDWYRVGG